ncbi:hypothetical protein JHK85_006311 [Glycine max]|nr:hypothetical protein JHK87_005997 [Glycine soja]KAG5053801.1 hypothetical protein JHK85_006311 [Glycine max]
MRRIPTTSISIPFTLSQPSFPWKDENRDLVDQYILPQAADAISQGRFGFASYCIYDVLKEVSSYDKKFSGATQAPLGDRNDIVQKLVNMASAIVKLLLKG